MIKRHIRRFVRIDYVLTRLAVIVLACLVILLGLDSAIKWALVSLGETAAGARVDIGDVSTGLLPPRVEIRDAAVADHYDPYSNVFEFKRLAFTLRLRPLMEKKFILDDAVLTGLRFGTRRAASGASGDNLSLFESAKIAQLRRAGGSILIARPDAARADALEAEPPPQEALESVVLAENLLERARSANALVKTALSKADFRGREAKIRYAVARAQAIKKQRARQRALRRALASAELLDGELALLSVSAQATLSDLNGAAATLADARGRDVAALLSRHNLPLTDAASVSEALFGPRAAQALEAAMRWYFIGNTYLPRKKAALPPAHGRLIHFPEEHHYPPFAITSMRISGEVDPGDGAPPLPFSGTAEGFSSHPGIYGEPIIIHLSGARPGTSFSLDMRVDHTSPLPRDTIAFSARGFAAGKFSAPGANGLRLELSGGTANATGALSMSGGHLFGTVAMEHAGQVFSAGYSGTDLLAAAAARAAGALSAGTSASRAVMRLSGTLKAPQIAIESDIGSAISSTLAPVVGPQAQRCRAILERKVEQAAKPLQDRLAQELAAQQQEISALFSQTQAPLTALISEIEAQMLDTQKNGPSRKIPRK